MAPTMPSMLLNSKQASEDQSMRYYVDTGLLDCPICMEPFSPPVYQCKNGHSVCSFCCQKIPEQKCPSCSQPTGEIRCLMVEKIMESMQVPCKHAPHGCNEMLQYSNGTERRRHEEENCMHKLLPCLHPSCLHKGPCSALPSHLTAAHGVQREQLGPQRCAKFQMSSVDHFMMVDLGNNGLMLVHRVPDKKGDIFLCSTITGTSQKFKLQLKCKNGTSIYSIQASTPNIQKFVERSFVSINRLLIFGVDMGHPRKYDVEVSLVRGS